MKKKALVATLAGLCMVVGATGCAGVRTGEMVYDENTVYEWRMVHEEYTNDMQDVYCKEFAKLLHEKSDGRINLQIYQVGQIGNALQACEILQNGGVEFAMISPGNTGTVVPENQLFSLHFLFPQDMGKTQKVLKESVALNEMLAEKYLKKNIMPLNFWTEGAMQWTANKPLTSPDGFKGLKFRTMQSPMILAAYEAYGANPTPMSYTEVYSGLQLNMIEGQENPISAIYTSKFHEVQDYLIEANSNLSTQPSENHVFSRLFACVILKPYVFSLVFALMSENKGNFLLFAADYLIQQPCGSTLRFPCSVSVDIHCGTDISVSEKLLHILWGSPI